MGDRNFRQMLEAKWAEGKFVCVGLDSEIKKLPECVLVVEVIDYLDDYDEPKSIFAFNKAIIDATKDLVCAYKPNIAFYEGYDGGMHTLKRSVQYCHRVAPDVPIILDAKRGDIGNTNNGYVQMAFDYLGADAITVPPYMGKESLMPFLAQEDKGVIVLSRTSNPGAGEFQDLMVDGEPLFMHVARKVANDWNDVSGNCAIVVGATYPDELAKVRQAVGDLPILIPGIGAQGGDVEKTVKAGKDSRGKGMIINSARGIIYASNGEDFAEAARRETQKLHDLINQYR